jgi:hypothetical protein
MLPTSSARSVSKRQPPPIIAVVPPADTRARDGLSGGGVSLEAVEATGGVGGLSVTCGLSVTAGLSVTDELGVSGGFGGFAREFLTYVREECPKAPILVFGASGARTLRDAGVVSPLHSIATVGSSIM